jgi:hypothetical protein
MAAAKRTAIMIECRHLVTDLVRRKVEVIVQDSTVGTEVTKHANLREATAVPETNVLTSEALCHFPVRAL